MTPHLGPQNVDLERAATSRWRKAEGSQFAQGPRNRGKELNLPSPLLLPSADSLPPTLGEPSVGAWRREGLRCLLLESHTAACGRNSRDAQHISPAATPLSLSCINPQTGLFGGRVRE